MLFFVREKLKNMSPYKPAPTRKPDLEEEGADDRQLCGSAAEQGVASSSFASPNSFSSSSADKRKGRFLCDTNNILAVVSIVGYSCTSLAVVFLNRHLFSETFKFPIFVSFFQQLVGLAVYHILSLPSLYTGNSGSHFFRFIKFDFVVMYRILPLSLLFVGMVGFSNMCLQFVLVSTYQVARSLTLIFNMCLSAIFLQTKFSKQAVCACFLVSFGFLVGSLDTTTLSILGVIFGGCSSLFQAAYSVLLKRVLVYVNNDQNVIVYYNMCFSSVLFLPVIFIVGESSCFSSLPLNFMEPASMRVWLQLILSGTMGLFLTLSSYVCVRVTTPVTFNVVGYAKASLQSAVGILVLGEPYTLKSLTGITLTVVGSFWYSHIKLHESTNNNKINCSNSTPSETSGIKNK